MKPLKDILISENVTIQSAIDNNRELIAIRNNLNINILEGEISTMFINERISKNTLFIKNNINDNL